MRQSNMDAQRRWMEQQRMKCVIQLRQAALDTLMTIRAQAQYSHVRKRLNKQISVSRTAQLGCIHH